MPGAQLQAARLSISRHSEFGPHGLGRHGLTFGAGSCSCLPEYFGDPYSGCRPECVQNSDCDRSRACINNKCQDPCPGVCGINAECRVFNHAPNCMCFDGYTGDPHRSCAVIEVTTITPINPCHPSPCGPYSECHESNGHAVCSCVDGYVGAPPSCKPECVVSSECPQNRACINQKCADPCRGACGNNARCRVVNHNPICTCAPGLTGDPFSTCVQEEETPRNPQNPCIPSPCGPNSLCREIGGQAACSCQTNYVGRPPNCRPECTNNDECPNNLSCQNERCIDPCPGSCGNNAFCKVVQHNAICSCADGYEGDPITGCDLVQPVLPKQPPTSPCEPSPCGPHAECRERNGAGACYCHEGFEGNPFDTERGCRRECEANDDCSTAQACVRFKCVDPCNNICGEFAICSVENHVPTCNCPPGYTGDPFFQCKQIPVTPPPIINPCVPSPCGPNSICREINEQAVCSCQSGFINQPPNCRPECIVSSECAPERACVNNKCVDPCLHTCGIRAICTTKNHSPICTCARGMTGDPFVQCSKIPIIHEPTATERPPSCVPSPCGPNSKCQIVGGNPACSCLQDFIGAPPNCRPECVLNSECGPTEACINQKCRDPCPGSCGFEAKCHVLNHIPICNCIDGYTGDPFIRCSPIPPVTEAPKTQNDPCDPSPCGPNADCFNGECRCQDNYQGNPYDGCRPECTLSADCARDKACMRNKCVDPCPGTCGINAVCEVLNHIPVCSCIPDYEGDPFSKCRPKVIIKQPEQVCSPSPCGANSQCRDVNGHAVCSCLDGYIGSPPQCRPECVVSSECSALQACVNKKCTDPCAGACGIDARCEVINHSPICGCPPGKTGDPFQRCLDLPPPEPPKSRDPDVPRDPCVPSPCGPNSICKASASGPSCQCLPEFFGSPPNCRPECIINPDCPSSQACINNKCSNPCPGSCGTNAECRVISHTVSCSCPVGFAGNAFVQCVPALEEPIKPCEPSPCGPNAECIERNGAASCKCIDDYQGNPYDGCRPECILSSDCPTDKACIRNKCKDPCPGICGSNAQCYAVNHVPNCVCNEGYTGDPFSNCQRQIAPPQPPPQGNPCQPSPCGPNSRCRVANELAVCSCLDAFIGAPPNCKPECTVNTECPQNKACHNFRCANPCAGTCGVDAKCEVINHNPICSCPLDMTGDPFSRCYPAPPAPKDEPKPRNPCYPSPCGLYAECRVNGDQPSCSCLPNYIGAPPNCRPECVVNTDCPSDKSCIAEKCRNPCEGTCGINSECRIQNHLAICTCRNGFTGDPFSQCIEIIEIKTPPTASTDPCELQPCGANAECDGGICTCIRDYQGDPYVGCRPECTLSTDCSPNRACLNKKCVDPCPGTCGQSAQCDVSNHIPICSCPKGYTGDPFINCHPEVLREPAPKDPCHPSPCGPNSVCQASAQGAVCACQPGMLGSPPACKPECIVSSECSLQTACIQKKCVDPCPGACGQFARCQVINHNPICTCNNGYTGDPFTRCYQEERVEEKRPPPTNPCIPSPCGPNSECKVIGDSPACSCAVSFLGKPPNCRPECTINPECPPTKACIRQKCEDPCAGSCGFNARCNVANHMPICTCEVGYTGDPFTGCQPVQADPPVNVSPCQPSPCGPNSQCRDSNGQAVCSCIPEFVGTPPSCRPECVVSSECPLDKACINQKCKDPCPGACGLNAECHVRNHSPLCACRTGYTGEAFTSCQPIPPPRTPEPPQADINPCIPSPCGPYSQCREVNNAASCSCLTEYIGAPPNCRPECTINAECPGNTACLNQRCRDPCPGSCGFSALCSVIKHIPSCSCPIGYTGDPFTNCRPLPPPPPAPKPNEPVDPCIPSPCGANALCNPSSCGPNSKCRRPEDSYVCACVKDYNGNPYEGCRPECISNSECSPSLACIRNKCVDPCPGTCGVEALCTIHNHIPICSCPTGYTGNAFVQCSPIVIEKTPIEHRDPCYPTPCGLNSICKVRRDQAVCECVPGFLGNPPSCRAECIVSSECPSDKACINQKCKDPCPGACGLNAECHVRNHSPLCACKTGYTGEAFTSCQPIPPPRTPEPPQADVNPCTPSPCGPYSECREVNKAASCSCLAEYIGAPPNCRPECTISGECPNNLACINQRCRDPCPGACGSNANCIVALHIPNCHCPADMTGDPFRVCYEAPKTLPPPPQQEPRDPCRPSPCGPNSECRGRGDSYTCACINDYIGNPYEGCRPECVGNSECASNRACIRNKCVDPCPGTCGVEALCTIHNHIPICSCPTGYSGNAFVQCSPIVIEHIPQERRDPCYPTPCGINTACKVQRDQAVCECLPGFFGNPQGQGCRPECTLSSDCAKDKACVNSKCVDPCPGVCGFGAQCQTVNHNPICSCPSPMVGNPFVECHAPPKPVDPCNPSPCRSNGICQVLNGAATCTYPECVTNEDCLRNRACINQKCRDPCINACGLNAICNAINHKAVCTCPQGYYGSPFNQCLPQIEDIPEPRPECTTDAECSNDKACVNQVCKNPCELSNICGTNARCHVQLHRPLCVCNEGYTGNAFSYCHLIGCRSDEECPATEACINKQCTDPCPYTQCGTNAICRADYNHKARCHCPDGYRGNPLVHCERPECTRDEECAFNLACRNERCEDPCNCGIGAQCRVDNHRAQCRCPPGYTGNPLVSCVLEEPKFAPQCTMDADCTSKLACFGGECKNPCFVTQPCGANAICSVVDTLPLRTMICQCESGYVGDADVGCRKEPARDHGCQSNSECQDTEACRNGVCVNPCIDVSPCARTAECLAQRHRAVCSCPLGTQGDPFTNCYQPPEITAGCKHDSECTPTTACINQRCQDPCAEANPCAGNAECRVRNSRPICSCPAGWGGDPQVQCYKPECKINADCPYDKACISENCVNPCNYGEVRCGIGAQCAPQNHQAVCICPPGTQGNPFVSCITGHCQYNEDCADHEACDRLNRVCRPVCDEDTCALNAVCTGRRHQPQCACRTGYIGNPFVQCDLPREPPTKVQPECTQDADCPTQLACINQHCSNPCATPHVCTPQQTCHVLDTLPLRTMICKCPSDTITDNSGNCVPIKHEVVSGCQSNDECGNTEVCQRGVCIDACRLERCGVNAQCRSRDHYAECTCARGYEGNPRMECRLIVHEQPKTPNAECTKNDDCPYDKNCANERCVNPCVEDACGRGAYCHVQNREAVCRCPPGFSGDARVACIPPPDVSTIGCKSNSDCALSESCVNERCVNPCNCGPNADCIVRNHHPVCYCQPGYSGNAQFGCVQIGCQSDDECSTDQQCVNRECVNPCLISDPCALNAECFGRNHRANCRCPAGLEGNPFQRCVRVECHSDYDCATNQACVRNQCVNPCQDSPCAQNAICQPLQHRAVCRCPETMPLGNPYAYCERRPVEPVCRDDGDCPSRLACIDNKCQNPCTILSPCASSAQCSVLDSVPVRTMVCECPESYVPDARGECKQIILQSPPGCSTDADCPDQEACINRQCRNPCNCGTNAICRVQNHRATCSCQDGFEGNPYSYCRTIGCRIDSECDSGKACINGNCINPCLVNDPCGINAECYVQSNQAMCRCKSGYRGNAYERCRVIGCLTNNDCPTDKMCQNEQCVNPCIYQNPCSPHAECRAQNHLAVCRCPAGFLGNPYVDCRPEPQPVCKVDTDCPARLACINDECVNPCLTLEPCNRPAQCEVTPTSPVRTMICVCPDGYISSGSGTCKPTKTVVEVGGCIADSDCAKDKACVNGICRDPCNCGLNAECRIKDHKPVCTCRQGYEGNPEFECSKVECAINSDCPATHACRNQLCVPACQGEQCGTNAQCLAVDHRAICECAPGFHGNARISCTPLGCRADNECPSDKACVNGKCEDPCETKAVCAYDEICKVYQHRPECGCPPGTIARRNGCEPLREIPICRYDGDCPSQTACIRGECVNPCNATHPCGVNADCRVLDTVPVRTMICECLEGYTGNAAVQCDKRSLCVIEKGFVRDVDGQCVCPPGTALDVYEYCTPCLPQQGYKIDENGRCVCALERGMVIDERGRCICPTDHGYRLTPAGECIAEDQPGCETNDDCADNRFCNTRTNTCEDPCLQKVCGVNAFCNAINHRAQCQCITGYTGNPEIICNHTNFRTDFPRPDMLVSCLADGVQVEIHITEPGFNGVLYVKGHSKDEECRRVVNLAGESVPRTEIFRVHFGSCGMQAVKDIASFVLVIQKHPKLVTYKAQAYNIKCVYQTGEKNVTLGFNVSMLTTAGTIANTGPPPICQMRIITHEGEEINSAEIGDNLKLQVDVEPSTIYGGFARSCIAKTMEDNVENEYIVTDENGCATDASIFGEWEYNPDTNSLMANFNAFKFPSSDNIRFQCNIRVCFGKCQPVNCRGYNAFGRRRRRAIADNSTDAATAVATNTGMEGQLREEITISSNAILTFEKRSGPGINDANIKPAAQRVEDICVSMVGLIIALVITALLALVAVAVAVSCWLMAYRRRPKTLAPLPHPPEFPNPLFANPEAVPEPTPDYLS